MARPVRTAVLALTLVLCAALHGWAQGAVTYRLVFADRVHHVMDVEATFPDVPPGPLQLRISRSSPGRYALHQFAKNVFDVRVTDTAGQPLGVTRTRPEEWTVGDHPTTVRVNYRVFG